jgi:putative thioredoxin
MTDPRRQAAQAALSAAFSRAVDLSSLNRAPAAPGAATAGAASTGQDSAAAGEYVIDATDASFQQVLQASARVPIVVDLWATWCEPCKQLSPVLEKLAAEGHGTWILAKVDVDANPGIAQAFQVQSIPTVVALAGGQPVAAFSGAQPEAQVRAWITQLIDQLRDALPGIREAEAAAPEPEPEPEDPRLTAAQDASDRGDFAAAAAAYQSLLDDEPGNTEAAAGLAWAQLLHRAAAVDDTTIARSDAQPDDVALAVAAADAEVASGDAPSAFARLVTAIVRTSDPERAQARTHLLDLFALFAPDDPDVMAARRALAAALY